MKKAVILSSNDGNRQVLTDVLRDSEVLDIVAVTFEQVPSIEDKERLNYDLIIIDLTSLDRDLLKTLKYIRLRAKNAKCIALHIYRNKKLVEPILQQGIDAYIPVDYAVDELPVAVNILRRGSSFRSRYLSD